MALVFVTYLALKGLKKIWNIDLMTAGMLGLGSAVAVFLVVKPLIARASTRLNNDQESINQLFTVPLIFAAALLSFAHGANDVANAVGPLAAINDAVANGGVSTRASIPLWIMVVGALGIAVGLALYGPKLIRTVGSEITHLDKMRAYCVAIAAAITVIIASQFGLPVSSTHIAVGGVFGVGFVREYLHAHRTRLGIDIKHRVKGDCPQAVDAFLHEFESAAIADQNAMLKALKKNRCGRLYLAKKDRTILRSEYRKEFVKRSMLVKIVTAWLVTVPASGLMAAAMFYAIRGFMIP
jgi:PiT family inorganic phosphate transporter